MGALLNAELRGWRPGAVLNGFAAGSTAGAELTLTGIKAGDEIRRAVYYPASGLPSSVLSEISVFADGKVKCASTNTSNGTIEVEWLAAASL